VIEPTSHTVIDTLVALDMRALKHELDNLRAIRDWAIANLGLDYTAGDRVVIDSVKPSRVGGGWTAYAEALVIGQTGVAGEIKFNAARWTWQVTVTMDRAWATSRLHSDGKVTRFWCGPVGEIPEGYEPPSRYDQEHYPDGRGKNFMMDVTWVRRVT